MQMYFSHASTFQIITSRYNDPAGQATSQFPLMNERNSVLLMEIDFASKTKCKKVYLFTIHFNVAMVKVIPKNKCNFRISMEKTSTLRMCVRLATKIKTKLNMIFCALPTVVYRFKSHLICASSS